MKEIQSRPLAWAALKKDIVDAYQDGRSEALEMAESEGIEVEGLDFQIPELEEAIDSFLDRLENLFEEFQSEVEDSIYTAIQEAAQEKK